MAYKQPVTKGEIEAIRGIRCDRVLEGLGKKNLVAEVGRSDAVGRPILYGTTDEFLKQFGFSSLKELPDIVDIENALEEGSDENEMMYSQQISIDLSKAEIEHELSPAESNAITTEHGNHATDMDMTERDITAAKGDSAKTE